MTDATVTLNILDALGDIYDAARTKIWVEFNTDTGFIVDEDGRQRVGAGTVTINTDGSATIAGIPVPSVATNPTDFQVRINFDAPPRAARQREVKRDVGTFGWMTITEDADLADLIAEQYAPPSWQSTFIAQAQALLAQQESLADVDDTDSAVAYALEFGTQSPSVLSDSLAGDEYTPGMTPVEAVDARIGLYTATPTWDDWPAFGIIAHQGAANIFPRETAEAMYGSFNMGDASDFDVVYTKDEVGVVSHDNTLVTDTTDTRNIADISSTGLNFITVDAGSWFATQWGNLKLLPLADLLGALGHKRRISLEAKVEGQAALLAADIVAASLQNSVMVSTAFWSDVDDLVSAGLTNVGYVMTTGSEKTAAELAAAGVTWAHVAVTAAALNAGWVAGMHAQGIKVMVYTVNRQMDVAPLVTMGADGIFSDDPLYVAGALGDYRYRRTTDTFANKTYGHGHIAGSANKRGVYGTTNSWGFDDVTNAGARTVLAGEFCPLAKADGTPYNPATDTITIDFTIDVDSQSDSGRWMGMYVGFSTDRPMNDGGTLYADNDGYRCLINQSGSCAVQKYTNGAVDGSPATQATAAITPPVTNVQMRITVSPTQVKMERRNGTTGTATLTDSTHRGAYFHFGASGTTGRFRSVSVSVT